MRKITFALIVVAMFALLIAEVHAAWNITQNAGMAEVTATYGRIHTKTNWIGYDQPDQEASACFEFAGFTGDNGNNHLAFGRWQATATVKWKYQGAYGLVFDYCDIIYQINSYGEVWQYKFSYIWKFWAGFYPTENFSVYNQANGYGWSQLYTDVITMDQGYNAQQDCWLPRHSFSLQACRTIQFIDSLFIVYKDSQDGSHTQLWTSPVLSFGYLFDYSHAASLDVSEHIYRDMGSKDCQVTFDHYGLKNRQEQLIGDCNGDGVVDIYDAMYLSNRMNKKHPNYPWMSDPPASWFTWSSMEADLNADGIIDIYDSILLSNHFGQTLP